MMEVKSAWAAQPNIPDRLELGRSGVAALAIRLGSVALAFLASLIYARALGTNDFGRYAHVTAVVTVLSIPAALGLPQYLLKQAAGHPERIAQLRSWADRRSLPAGLAVSALMCALAAVSDETTRWLFVIAAPIPLLTTRGSIRRALLQSLGLIAKSQFSLLLVAPAAALLVTSSLWVTQGHVEAWQLMLATLAASLLPTAINNRQLLRYTPTNTESRPGTLPASTLAASIRFMWLGGMYLLISRLDLIMLGTLSDPASAGMYAVATRAADLVPLILITVNAVLAPRIAELHRKGCHSQLQNLITRSMRLVTITTFPLAVGLFIFSEVLLRFFYGDTYAAASPVLRLLTLAQFILVLGGPLGTLLEMTGHERASLRIMVWIVALNVVLNSALIPIMHAEGAAISTCLSLIVGRILLWRAVRRTTLIRPTAFRL